MNISTGKSISVNELAETMMAINHSLVEVDYKPERPGDIPHSLLSRNLAFNMMGWAPVYDLETGLRDMLNK
jgi:UDP-glucose 4-epimerase